MADLASFLFMAVGISLSGVMAPGPMTAATLAAGTRTPHAGILIALGHAAIEFPLIVLIIRGVGPWLEMPGVRTGIGLAGGAFLLLMGTQMLMGLGKIDETMAASSRRSPFWTGVVLTGANPYFLLWWAIIGITLATKAVDLGILAFALFALIHWLCDLVWLEALSLAAFKGSKLLGRRSQQVVLAVCAVMLLFFGGKFLYEAGSSLLTAA